MKHGGSSRSPQLLCRCGHIFHVHRPGPCNVVQGCSCDGFVEGPTIRASRAGDWLPQQTIRFSQIREAG